MEKRKIFKYFCIILNLILPVFAILTFSGIYEINLYNYLWLGLYGSILICFVLKSKLYKTIIIISNLAVILLCSFAALMGGIAGIKLILLHLLIPFYSYFIGYIN